MYFLDQENNPYKISLFQLDVKFLNDTYRVKYCSIFN